MIPVTLKPGREGPVRAGHPWVFSGAIANISAKEPAGSLAHVVTANGQMLARAISTQSVRLRFEC